MKDAIFIAGPAGTGKSTLCASLKEWYTHEGMNAAVVNLDPGAEFIPYEADVDVREWISISQIMHTMWTLGQRGHHT